MPPVLSRHFLAEALRNRQPLITNELPTRPPLFVLSTGRSGTFTLAALLTLAPRTWSWHEPLPDLYRLARRVHQLPDTDSEVVAEALLLARGALWQAANLAGKRYTEASNYIIMLAPFLHYMMPNARFLHISRSPDDFVRSAIAFGWYSSSHMSRSRISPRPGSSAAAHWDSWDPFSKNVWLWQEVNHFARDFVGTLPSGQGLHLRSEDIFAADQETLSQLFALVDSDLPPHQRVRRVLDRQLNAGRYRSGTRPVADFSAAQREFLYQECGQLARELGYGSADG